MTTTQTNAQILKSLKNLTTSLGFKWRAFQAKEKSPSVIQKAKKDFEFSRLALHNFREIVSQ